jgi:hypothetical protein
MFRELLGELDPRVLLFGGFAIGIMSVAKHFYTADVVNRFQEFLIIKEKYTWIKLDALGHEIAASAEKFTPNPKFAHKISDDDTILVNNGEVQLIAQTAEIELVSDLMKLREDLALICYEHLQENNYQFDSMSHEMLCRLDIWLRFFLNDRSLPQSLNDGLIPSPTRQVLVESHTVIEKIIKDRKLIPDTAIPKVDHIVLYETHGTEFGEDGYNSTVFFNSLKQIGRDMSLQEEGEVKFWPQDGASKESYYGALDSSTLEVTWHDFLTNTFNSVTVPVLVEIGTGALVGCLLSLFIDKNYSKIKYSCFKFFAKLRSITR